MHMNVIILIKLPSSIMHHLLTRHMDALTFKNGFGEWCITYRKANWCYVMNCMRTEMAHTHKLIRNWKNCHDKLLSTSTPLMGLYALIYGVPVIVVNWRGTDSGTSSRYRPYTVISRPIITNIPPITSFTWRIESKM